MSNKLIYNNKVVEISPGKKTILKCKEKIM